MITIGLIPAAGKSRRMGRPKLLLPLGQTTVLENVLSAVRMAGVADTLVVVAPNGDGVARVAEASGARVQRLAEDTPDMRATCQHGLAWIETHFHLVESDGVLLLPADHPTVRPEVVRALLAEAGANRDKSIIVPVHGGRRGHPTWLRWWHAAAIRALPATQGLNTYIRTHADTTLELSWPNDDILRDLDTPEDYERLMDG